MPLTLTEKLDSRKWNTGDNASVEMVYILTGTSDDLTAKTLLLSSTPTEYDGLARDEISLEPIFVDTAAGAGKWDCRVRYAEAASELSPRRKLWRRSRHRQEAHRGLHQEGLR